MDEDQSIYLSTLSKDIYHFIPSLDSIVLFEFNQPLSVYRDSSTYFMLRHADKDFFYVQAYNIGYLKISKKSGRILVYNNEGFFYRLYFFDNNPFLGIAHSGKNLIGLKTDSYKIQVQQAKSTRPSYAFKIDDSRTIVNLMHTRYIFEGQNLKKIQKGIEFSSFYAMDNNQGYLSAHIDKHGVRYYGSYKNLLDDQFIKIIDGVSATCILRDKQKNFFVTTTDRGFYYLKHNFIEPIKLMKWTDSDIRNIVFEDSSKLFLICDENVVLEYNLFHRNVCLIEKSNYELGDFMYDNDLRKVIIGSNYSKNNFGKNKTVLLKDNEGYSAGFRKLIRLDNYRNLGVSFSSYFLIYDEDFQNILYSSKHKLPLTKPMSGFAYKDSLIIIGTITGLCLLENNRLKVLNNIHPLFASRINEIAKDHNYFYLATLGQGLLIWDGDKQVTQLTENEGLVSNNLESVYVDSKGLIYTCTNSGLSIIKVENGTFQIYNLTTHHGLPSNRVREVIEIGGEIYIATASGLCKLNSLPENPAPIPPILEEIKVNEQVFKPGFFPYHLSFKENNISLSFRSLDIAMLGDLKYRVSTDENKWSAVEGTTTSFLDLSPGHHTFYVQASNYKDAWSESVKYSVTISPAWWNTIYFRLGTISLLSGLGLVLYKRRVSQLKEVNTLQKEVYKLERSALAAQMNPHFIFNSLNSIQNYIISHDKETAMDYLGQFAKLIRLNLKGSMDEKVSLDSEIKLLKYYLNLEQMRFNHNFEYDIKAEAVEEPESIFFPPLLIQPFVENAILHGVQHLVSGGMITVEFSRHNDYLQVIISDNGPGIRTTETKKQRQSYGMSITKKRLEKINSSSDFTYEISPSLSGSGTSVKIRIQI